MAESLGEVVLGVRVDSAQAIAGLNAVRQAAERSVQTRPQAAGQLPTLPQIKDDPFKGVGDSADTARGAVRSLGGELARTVAGLVSIGTVAAFFKQSIDAAVELETITKKLSNTLGEGGAAKALTFTKGLANDLGLSFKVLASSFGSFTAAATSAGVPLKTQEELFKAVATASQRLGLSNDELKGSLLALQQVASKGTVQMEELRGQLGERLPVAFGATAKGLGVTQKELIKLVETGQLTSTQFFGALTKGLNDLAGASAGAPTVAQSFQQLGNAWDELQTSFGQNLLPGVTEGVRVLQSVVEGLGRKTIADRLGFNTGAIGNLGVLSDSAFNAVEAFGSLQKQFNLTDKQATALFFDAKKSKGFLPDQNLTVQQTDALIAEVERLAKNFRERFPIQEPLIDQAIVDKTLNTVKKIQDQIKEQQQKQSGFTVDSAAFAEAQKEITELGIKLKEIDGKKAQISAEYTLKGIDSGKVTNSIQNVQQSLQELNTAQVTLDIDSSQFIEVGRQIVTTEQDLQELQARQTVVRIKARVEGFAAGSIRKSLQNLQQQVSDFEQIRATIDINSPSLPIVTRGLVLAREQLDQVDGRKARVEVEVIQSGIAFGEITNNLNNLERRIAGLRTLQVTLPIDSAEFDRVASAVRGLQAQQAAATNNIKESTVSVGDALIAGSRQAAAILGDSVKSLRSALESGFKFLTAERQQQVLTAARADIERGVSAGEIDQVQARNAIFGGAESIISLGNQSKNILEAVNKFRQSVQDQKNANAQVATSATKLATSFENGVAVIRQTNVPLPNQPKQPEKFTPQGDSKTAALEAVYNSLISSNETLAGNLQLNSEAVAALVSKNWDVNVTVNAANGSTPINAVVSYAQ